jgi:hypothetical protein
MRLTVNVLVILAAVIIVIASFGYLSVIGPERGGAQLMSTFSTQTKGKLSRASPASRSPNGGAQTVGAADAEDVGTSWFKLPSFAKTKALPYRQEPGLSESLGVDYPDGDFDVENGFEGSSGGGGGGGGLMKGRRYRLTKLIVEIESSLAAVIPPSSVVRYAKSRKHIAQGPAVFTCAMSDKYTFRDASLFAGTLRVSGFTGDLVVALAENSNVTLFNAMDHYNAVQYRLKTHCIGLDNDKVCTLVGQNNPSPELNSNKYYPLAMLRFYLYQFWARQYEPQARILVTDFRDVFFQSNPFKYKPNEWGPPRYQLVAFQEVYPNKVIYRCPFNKGLIYRL